ncbi:MAG TPA: hypothetical protein VHY08_10060 [Bacillota bacterium]|nr:hypothetical protein [Bacillota bacterium]
MKLKKMTLSVMIIVVVFLIFSTAAYAQDDYSENSDWGFGPYVDLSGGLGLTVKYNGFTLFDGLKTNVYLSGVANYNMSGFFRNPDGTEYNPTVDEMMNGFYRRRNYGIGVGAGQELIHDTENNHSLLEAFLFYKYNKERYLEDEWPSNSLIYDTNLPDRFGLEQKIILGGLFYNNVQINAVDQTREGMSCLVTIENAPRTLNQYADYTRFHTSIIGFSTLKNDDTISVYVGNRLILDRLTGDNIPIYARTTFGSAIREFVPMPGVELPGLGGGFRGVPMGQFDGFAKVVNNFDLRINYPQVWGPDYIPEMIFYGDVGAKDDLNGQINWGDCKYSLGMGLGVHFTRWYNTDILLYYNYFINDQEASFSFMLGFTHF